MKENINHIDGLIVRFLDGSIGAEEKEELHSLLESNEKNQRRLKEYYDIWNMSAQKSMIFEPMKAFDRFTERIESQVPPQKSRPVLRNLIYFSTGIVAAIVIAVLLKLPLTQDLISISKPQIITFSMPDHAKGNLKLSDQTIVWLNKNSRLTYPDVFTADKREVSVDGEAYFEVSKDKKKPFIIDLGNEKITVLGTSFNVKNRKDKEYTEITLLSGSVRVDFEKEKKNYTLEPNERIVYSKRTGRLKIEPVNAKIYNIWIKDKLTFDNANLGYIIACLEKWYDLKIEYTENVKKMEGISLSVRDESVEEVLKGIQYIAPIKYTILTNEINLIK